MYKRLEWAALAERPKRLNFYGFRNGQRIFEFYAEVTNCTVHFGLASQMLHCTQIAGFLVDLCNFRAPHRVCSECRRL